MGAPKGNKVQELIPQVYKVFIYSLNISPIPLSPHDLHKCKWRSISRPTSSLLSSNDPGKHGSFTMPGM